MNADELQALGDALPREMARVRDTILPVYLEAGKAGALAVLFMRADLDRATKALAEQDVVACLRAYRALQGYSL